MQINTIKCNFEYGKDRCADVQLKVGEIGQITNALLYATKQPNPPKELIELHKNMYVLMSLVKDGGLDRVAIKYLNELEERDKRCDA